MDCRECSAAFQPVQPSQQKFCSSRCRLKAYRATAKYRATSKRWRAKSASKWTEYQRRYQHRHREELLAKRRVYERQRLEQPKVLAAKRAHGRATYYRAIAARRAKRHQRYENGLKRLLSDDFLLEIRLLILAMKRKLRPVDWSAGNRRLFHVEHHRQ